MSMLKSTLLAAAATVAVASAAQAADPIMPMPVTPVAPVVDPVYDWSGFYAGVRVGGQNDITASTTDWLIGGELGVNAQWDMFVLGAEAAVDAVFATPDTYAYGEITARGGVAFSEVLLYGTVGYGSDFDAAGGVGDHILAGVGVEFAATDSISVDGRYVYGWEQSGAVGASDIHKFTIGANFHF
jgi:outer membrane immunogenic protein